MSSSFRAHGFGAAGGGALGAYQAGMYEALVETSIHPDWIAGFGSAGVFLLRRLQHNAKIVVRHHAFSMG